MNKAGYMKLFAVVFALLAIASAAIHFKRSWPEKQGDIIARVAIVICIFVLWKLLSQKKLK